MFTKEGFDILNKYLKENGFNGTDDGLHKHIQLAKDFTDLKKLEYSIERIRNKMDIPYEYDEMWKFIKKCFVKYDNKRINADFHSPSITFYSNRDSQLRLTIYFHDDSSFVSNGKHGEIVVRYLYGYDQKLKDEYVTLVDEKPYIER